MNLFDNILLDTILIVFPLLICTIYDAYNKVYNLKKIDLYLDFALITAVYLVINFKRGNYMFPFLTINIPLMIAYIKNQKLSIILISLFNFLVFTMSYNILFIFFLIEYISYYVIYKILKEKKSFVNIFTLEKIFCFLICEFITKPHISEHFNSHHNMLAIILPFILVTYIIVSVFNKTNEITEFNQHMKDLEKEKDIRMSLFKITHEIKNPITVCKGYLEMFDYTDQIKSKKYVNIMKNEISRVLILLEDFLSLNKIKIEKEIIDINYLLEEVTNNFIPILKEKNITRIFDIDEDELFMEADYNRICQVLINIIKNSVESIESNGCIKLYTKLNKDEFKIFIEDNGVGMTNEELKEISKPFFTTKKRGSGLGVYLSNQIICAHNGTIKYESEKEVGTKTIITLPYKKI